MSGRGNSTTEPTNGVKMLGMDRNTGKLLSGTDHIRQSIVDILTTPLGDACNAAGIWQQII